MDIYDRLVQLDNSLDRYKANDPTPWQIGQIFNALLDAVREAASSDPIVAVIEPVQSNSTGSFATVNIGAVRASIGQLMGAVEPDHGPMIA